MMLTLHNIVMMKRGRMPYPRRHDAHRHPKRRVGHAADDRRHGHRQVGIARSLPPPGRRPDPRDCGSSPTTWARSRSPTTAACSATAPKSARSSALDDLQQGYAFGQIDRAIIMSPQKINARVRPAGHHDGRSAARLSGRLSCSTPTTTRKSTTSTRSSSNSTSAEDALAVFREGAAMSKGTTTVDRLGTQLLRQHLRPAAVQRPPRAAGPQDLRRRRSTAACSSARCARGWALPATNRAGRKRWPGRCWR